MNMFDSLPSLLPILTHQLALGLIDLLEHLRHFLSSRKHIDGLSFGKVLDFRDASPAADQDVAGRKGFQIYSCKDVLSQEEQLLTLDCVRPEHDVGRDFLVHSAK
jgi:hypothetical protein